MSRLVSSTRATETSHQCFTLAPHLLTVDIGDLQETEITFAAGKMGGSFFRDCIQWTVAVQPPT